LFAGKELNEMEETITKKSSEIEALKAFLQEQKDEIQNLKNEREEKILKGDFRPEDQHKIQIRLEKAKETENQVISEENEVSNLKQKKDKIEKNIIQKPKSDTKRKAEEGCQGRRRSKRAKKIQLDSLN
tara:strand:- start:1270 stop:1656 length:387 start_codon:yes stop_codon:yes gene_type:complete